MVELSTDVKALAGIFTASGLVHLIRPQTFEALMPAFVPRHREVIIGSGVLELTCAAGLLYPRTRSAAGWVSAAVLLGVFPGNLKMTADAMKTHRAGYQAASLARLPLQFPLVRIALKAARG